MRNLIVLLIFFGAILSGCASVPSHQDAQSRKSVVTKSLGNEFDFFYIPSSGTIANATFIAMSKSSGPSSMAHQLASNLVRGVNENYKLAVSGPSSSKTYQVIKDAFSLLGDKKVNYLKFMYVGSDSNKEGIKSFVESAGATFIFATY